MKNIFEQWDLWQSVMDILEHQFGTSCEIILHDLTRGYENTIVDIRNGHITGRKIGGCGSNLGLEVLNGNIENGNRYNYVVHTRDGKILRSSSIYMRNDEGKVVGSLCINQDITDTVRFEQFLKGFNMYELNGPSEPKEEQEKGNRTEFFADDVSQLLEYLCIEGERKIGTKASDMDRKEKMSFIEFLDQKGAFLITGAALKICDMLHVSKFTFYNYLEKARENKTDINDSTLEKN